MSCHNNCHGAARVTVCISRDEFDRLRRIEMAQQNQPAADLLKAELAAAEASVASISEALDDSLRLRLDLTALGDRHFPNDRPDGESRQEQLFRLLDELAGFRKKVQQNADFLDALFPGDLKPGETRRQQFQRLIKELADRRNPLLNRECDQLQARLSAAEAYLKQTQDHVASVTRRLLACFTHDSLPGERWDGTVLRLLDELAALRQQNVSKELSGAGSARLKEEVSRLNAALETVRESEAEAWAGVQELIVERNEFVGRARELFPQPDEFRFDPYSWVLQLLRELNAHREGDKAIIKFLRETCRLTVPNEITADELIDLLECEMLR